MSRTQRRARSRAPKAQPRFAGDLRPILRGLARWAALSSVGLAGCGSHHMADGLSQDVPDASPSMAGAGSQGGSAAPTPEPDPTEPPPHPRPGGRDAPVPVAGMIAVDPVERDAGSPTPPATWTRLGCDDGGRPRLLEDLHLTREIDYAAIHSTGTLQGPPGGLPMVILVDETGARCGTASDRTACEDAIAALLVPSSDCTVSWDCDPFLLITAGDEVTRLDEQAEFSTLLGGVDTPTEAALVALLVGGQKITCGQDLSIPLATGTEVRELENGYEVRTDWEDCGVGIFTRTVQVAADGSVTELEFTQVGMSNCAVGRRPEGLRATAPLARTPLGAYLANAATLEAASVFAFERLARELEALGAPAALVHCAVRSALDEIRHARVVTALARRFGAEPAAPEYAALAPRAALAIALENAVEGCVRETYGALVAHYQAQTAQDPEVRAVLAEIAEDETRHAALAWDVARWLEPQLPGEAQRAVHAARAAALAQLRADLDPQLPARDRVLIGWPEPQLGLAMLDRLGAALGLPV